MTSEPGKTPATVATRTRTPKPEALSAEATLLSEISAKIDRLVAVVAVQGKDKEKQIEILSAAGCDSGFIGSVVGMTAGAVRVFQLRKRAKSAAAVSPQASAATD